jgi:NodT family efflux transporter outer membrane factor (OMF) lipoprotein
MGNSLATPTRRIRCARWIAWMAAALYGCAAGPDYVRPPVATPAAYKETQGWKQAAPRDEKPRGRWWEAFDDPQLNALESQVVISNQTIKAAEAQVRAARAITDEARAAFFPVVSGNAALTRSGGRTSVSGGSVNSTGGFGGANSYNASLDASWEIDLWGKIRRTVEASEASAQASAADLGAAILSAQGTLAEDYFMLRAQDAQIRLLNDTATEFEKALKLTRNQYAVGVAGQSDVALAETQLKSTQAQAIDATVQRAQLEHAIAILVGKPPAEFSIAVQPLATTFPDIPVALPSDLLERRPDIAAAERQTAAANAQIGVAEAAFFPSLTLSATGGFQSTLLSKLFTLPSRYWSLGPDLVEVIFDAGLRRAQTDQAIATYDQSVATYRQTVLAAFQDVEDNLAALRILENEAVVQAEAVKAARQSVTITLNQYRAGTVNYLSVVVVQTTLLTNERAALTILGQRLTDSAALIKALGGGWSEAPATADGAAQPKG